MAAEGMDSLTFQLPRSPPRGEAANRPQMGARPALPPASEVRSPPTERAQPWPGEAWPALTPPPARPRPPPTAHQFGAPSGRARLTHWGFAANPEARSSFKMKTTGELAVTSGIAR